MTYLIPPPATGGGLPSGTVTAFAGGSAPSDWLLCDGSAVSRSVYADLFSAIGTTYGAGDGSTTFNLPDLRGRAVFGKGTHADVDALNDSDGITTVANRRPKHQHTVYDPGHRHNTLYYKNVASSTHSYAYDTYRSNTVTFQDPTSYSTTGIKVNPEGSSSSSSPQDGPAYLVLNYIIKV